MSAGVVDLLALGYVGYGVARGRRRGLFQELPGAISMTLFLVTGCGLLHWSERALADVNHLVNQAASLTGLACLVTGAVVLMRELRAWIGRWAAQRYGAVETQKAGGGIAGGVRCLALVSALLLGFAHWPLHSLTRPITESSLLGRALTRFVLPVYEKTHGKQGT
jgi:hypothetical protein